MLCARPWDVKKDEVSASSLPAFPSVGPMCVKWIGSRTLAAELSGEHMGVLQRAFVDCASLGLSLGISESVGLSRVRWDRGNSGIWI